MQRQLLEIADRIPNDILLNLLKSFAQILTREPEQAPKTPFIRAFTKIVDDREQKQFSAIIEEDEDNHVIPHEENLQLRDESLDRNDISTDGNEGENECSFDYKVSNVVTQEVIYSMNSNERDDLQQLESTTADADAAITEADDTNNCNKKEETNGDQMVDNDTPAAVDENLLNENHDAIIENGGDISALNGNDAIDEGIEVEMPKLTDTSVAIVAENCGEEVEKKFDDVSQEAAVDDRVETCNNTENGEITGELEKTLDVEVEPIQKVTLDDIQREIQEMQMFIKHKSAQEEALNHEIIEDAFNVDVCLNIKKKKSESQSQHKKGTKTKAILANYLNGTAKEYLPKSSPVYDSAFPVPEDFVKEKTSKKKQKIKSHDVNWQKLVDSQRKVYK